MDTFTEVPTVWNQLAETMYLKESPMASINLSRIASFSFGRFQDYASDCFLCLRKDGAAIGDAGSARARACGFHSNSKLRLWWRLAIHVGRLYKRMPPSWLISDQSLNWSCSAAGENLN
jgi:hypothetical protein